MDCYTNTELKALMGRVDARYDEWRLDEDASPYLLSVVEAWKDDTESGDFLEWLTEAIPTLIWEWAHEQSANTEDFVAPETCQFCRDDWAINVIDGNSICADCLIAKNRGE